MAFAIPRARHIPLGQLRKRFSELDPETPVVVFCAIGVRAYNGARILMQNGFKNVRVYPGGMRFYQSTHYEEANMEKSEPTPVADSGNVDTSNAPVACMRVDCSGLQCPGPIMKVFETMKTLSDGQVMEVSASDPGFTRDIGAWCRRTGNTLVSNEKRGNDYVALVKKGGGAAEPVVKDTPQGKTIIVFSGDLDRVLASFIIANGAAAMGRPVTMFFTFWGLTALRKPEKQPLQKSFMASDEGKKTVEANVKEQLASDAVQAAIKEQVEAGLNSNADYASIKALKASLDQYAAFYSGIDAYTAGVSSATAGAKQVSAGAQQVAEGAGKLQNGGVSLVNGVSQLKDGAMQLSDGMQYFAENSLGKVVVNAKDTPNFVGNRIGVFAAVAALRLAEKYDYDIPTIDLLTGPIMAHPKSATCKTIDIVGVDILNAVAGNVLAASSDPREKVEYDPPEFLKQMIEDGNIGDKVKHGFYKKDIVDGKKALFCYDTKTKTYIQKKADDVPSIAEAKASDNKYAYMRPRR